MNYQNVCTCFCFGLSDEFLRVQYFCNNKKINYVKYEQKEYTI